MLFQFMATIKWWFIPHYALYHRELIGEIPRQILGNQDIKAYLQEMTTKITTEMTACSTIYLYTNCTVNK